MQWTLNVVTLICYQMYLMSWTLNYFTEMAFFFILFKQFWCIQYRTRTIISFCYCSVKQHTYNESVDSLSFNKLHLSETTFSSNIPTFAWRLVQLRVVTTEYITEDKFNSVTSIRTDYQRRIVCVFSVSSVKLFRWTLHRK